jgi:hypothetical protein
MSAPDDIARELAQAGYTGLFLTGDHSRAPAIWDGGANREALEAIVDGDGYGDLERVLAAEVLHAHADSRPDAALGPVYARALALSGVRDGPLVFSGNLWGLLGDGGDGPLGEHLLEAGDAAVEPLRALLDDTAPLLYEGSEDATIGNARGYRVKDAAAYFIGRLTGDDLALHEDPADRDAEIERLKDEGA